MPQVGNAAFGITCGNAPPSTTGLLGLSGAPLAAPITILGAQVWIDLGSPAFFVLGVGSNALGAAVVPIPIPPIPSLAGSQVCLQFAWGGPSSPPPCPATGVSASNALAVVVQP